MIQLIHAMPHQVLYSFQSVSFAFNSDAWVLQDVTVDIPEKSFVLLQGPTGAGKTTFLRMLRGDLVPDRGTVHVQGRDLRRFSDSDIQTLRQSTGVVFQESQFLANHTVFENMQFVLEAHGLYTGDDTDIHAMLSLVGLTEHAGRFPTELSGGERQLLQIARACVTRPFVVIADEPTAHLDHNTVHQIVDVLLRLNGLGTTVVVTTHNPQAFAGVPNMTKLSFDRGRITRVN